MLNIELIGHHAYRSWPQVSLKELIKFQHLMKQLVNLVSKYAHLPKFGKKRSSFPDFIPHQFCRALSFLLLFICMLALPTAQVIGQQTQMCENLINFTVVDLSASPTATQTLSNLEGTNKCCNSQQDNRNCHEFLFIMHPNAAGISFAQPSPPRQCAIDVHNLTNGCPVSDNPTSVCDPLCQEPEYNETTQQYEIRVVFCKPGNFNVTTMVFTSIADPEPITIAQGQSCETVITVSGTAGTYDWTCTSPIENLNYLDCGSGPGVGIICNAPTFNYTGPQVVNCAGEPIDYCVQQAGACSFTQATVTVTLYPDPASYVPVVTVDCASSGSPIILNAEVPGFPCPGDLQYQWFDNFGNLIEGANSSSYEPGSADGNTYNVEITSINATGCPPATGSAVATCCTPAITCPGNTTLECGDASGLAAWLANATVESCGDAYDVSTSYTLPNCTGRTGATGVVFSLDINGSSVATCSSILTIEDTTAPSVPSNGAATVACVADINEPTPPTVTDLCSGDIVPTGPSIFNNPNSLTCEGTLTYSWEYADCAGNSTTWSYVYTVEYQDFTMPANASATVSCPAATNTAPTPPTVVDNCGNTLTPSAPVVSAALACEGNRTYTYTYTDCEGNSHNWVYTYTVEYNDFSMPANASATVSCPAATNTAPTPPTVVDNCGNTLTPSAPVVSAALACEGNRTYTYTYTDCEGNSHNWVYTYTVEYNDFSMPANASATVSCPAETNTVPTPPTVVDNCGNAITPSGPAASALPTCAGTRTYTYTYTDCEGNSHNWVFTYAVEPPSLVLNFVNGTGLVACPDQTDLAPTPPTVTTYCGDVLTAALQSVSSKPACEGSRVYTYRYTDCMGNFADWEYNYIVEREAFTMPQNETASVNCPVNATLPTPPVVFDNCGKKLTPTGPVITNLTNAQGCQGSRKYAWTYTDCEGNTREWSKTFTFEYSADFYTFSDQYNVVSCISYAVAPVPPTIYDFCGNKINAVLTSTTQNLTAGGCSGTRTYTFTYTDCGGHSHPWVFTYQIGDNDGPLGACPTPLLGTNNNAPVTVNVSNLTCTAEVPCPDDFDFSKRIEALIEAGDYYDVCSGDDIIVKLDSWSEPWQCSDADGDGIFTFGQTFYFRISDPCGNEAASLCAVTYSGECLPIQTFTQDRWGVAGDQPGSAIGITDLALIQNLLANGPVSVGGSARSLTINNAADVQALLPGTGGPSKLANCHQTNMGGPNGAGCNPMGVGGLKNSLATNALALTLNIRFNQQYRGVNISNMSGMSLRCVDVHECITNCSSADCHVRMFDQAGTQHAFPYTIGGLLDLANLYLDGSKNLSIGQQTIYGTAINQALMNVNAYWTVEHPANACGIYNVNGGTVEDNKFPAIVAPNEGGNGISLKPNPASNEVTISVQELEEATPISVTIFNQLGQAVFSRDFGTTTSLTERINLDGMGDGLHFVMVQIGKEQYSQKLVISKL
jgi:Secretion system C-terminal sorting domain